MVTDRILSYLGDVPEGGLHLRYDPATGVLMAIAVHSTRLGPALGGCRMVPYADLEAAVADAVRLARGMTYKTAVADLPLGGGKAVIMAGPSVPDRAALFGQLGRFVHQLGGSYITAVDAGTRQADMDRVAQETPYVTCTRPRPGFSIGDPSPITAQGVFKGIQAAVHHVFSRDPGAGGRGITVGIQGLGQVGWALGEALHQWGADLVVADPVAERVHAAVHVWGARAVEPEQLPTVPLDVWAPCALGGVIHADLIPHLQCAVIAGGANNQLDTPADAERLRARGIWYAPDYVINAGGVIHAYAQYAVQSGQIPVQTAESQAWARCHAIGDRIGALFAQAQARGVSPVDIAAAWAEARLDAATS